MVHSCQKLTFVSNWPQNLLSLSFGSCTHIDSVWIWHIARVAALFHVWALSFVSAKSWFPWLLVDSVDFNVRSTYDFLTSTDLNIEVATVTQKYSICRSKGYDLCGWFFYTMKHFYSRQCLNFIWTVTLIFTWFS